MNASIILLDIGDKFLAGLSGLTDLIVAVYIAILVVQFLLILAGIKFRKRSYKIFLVIISILCLVPVADCLSYTNDMRFYIIGSIMLTLSFVGLILVRLRF